MAPSDWLFGPAGHLMALPPPEPDIDATVERFGGIHESLNGSRTVDKLGFRAGYSFSLIAVDELDYSWLEALYMGALPDALYLLDPMRKNLLTRESSLSRPSQSTRRGLSTDGNSFISWETSTDSPVIWTRKSVSWRDTGDGNSISFDRGIRIPAVPDESLTFSVYVSPSVSSDYRLDLNLYEDGSQSGTSQGTVTTASPEGWTRLTETFTSLGSTTAVVPSLTHVTGLGASDTATVMAPQVERGSTATSVVIGGGVVPVAIDSMGTTSPRFPLRNVSLSLLEL